MKKFLIKKIYFCLTFVFIIFLCPLFVSAESLTYDEAIEMVKEVMEQYYIRGQYMQYNYAKALYYDLEPEDATLQDNKYTVCAGYTHNVYNQAFGIKGHSTYMSAADTFKTNAFPQYNYHIVYAGQHAYQTIKNNPKKDNGSWLLYYECNVDTTDTGGDGYGRKRTKVRYVYGDTDTESEEGDFETLVKNVKPGDLVVFSGHALIVYDTVDTNGDGKKDDILILNATGGGHEIVSRIASTSSLYYGAFPSTRKGSDTFVWEKDGVTHKEGVVQLILLSQQPRFVTNKILNCKDIGSNKVDECAIVRPFYKGSDGNAVFNFGQNIDKSSNSVKETLIRTKYPGLFIEKTVSKGDNNNIYIGDELTYTIKVTNKSFVAKDDTTYDTFTVEETLDSNVECVDCSAQGWTVSGNTIKKTITKKLAPGGSVDLKYTVKVRDDLNVVGETIKSIGSFYDTSSNKGLLTTGIVENHVIPKVENIKKSYSICYDDNKSKYTGLKLIDEVYTCATGKNFNFDTFAFNSLFVKTGSSKTDGTIKFNSSLDTNHTKFKEMVFNNYFNGLIKYVNEEDDSVAYYYPRHTSKSATRAKTINSIDFKDGDILIYEIYDSKYTFEEGLYAYIYINGSFVGVNGSGYTHRNSFSPPYHTYAYWNDNGYDKTLTIADSLYVSDWSSLTSAERKFIHYQSLYGKDNYIILRPELAMREVVKIEVETMTTKTSYIQNYEKLSLSGGKINVYYNDGETESISMSDSNVSVTGFSNTTVGKKTLTVTYSGKKTTFDVNVVAKSISKIEIVSKPTKLSYVQNSETLNLSGGKIKATYNDNTTETIDMTNSNVSVTGFSNSTTGTKTLTVTYKSKKVTFDISIIDKLSLKDSFINTGFKIKESYVYGFVLSDLLSSVKAKVKLDYQTSSDGIIATGIEFKYNSEMLTAVVYGDLNGDGKINSADLLKMRQHLLGTSTLKGAYKEAAMIANGTTINSANLLRLRQHLLGQKLIEH